MKKNVLKKLLCTALAAVYIVTTVVPVMAEDTVVTAEAATKNVNAVYKYHLQGFDYDKKDWRTYSKSSFYKDLKALPSLGMGKNTIHVPALPSTKSISKGEDEYASFVKFKAPKTGTYVCTLTNLQGSDNKAVRAIHYFGFSQLAKKGKKYYLEDFDRTTVGDYDVLWENNYLQKLRSMVDSYATAHPDYVSILENDYRKKEYYMDDYPTDKIKFTVKLKKGQTYVYVIDNAGMSTFDIPRETDTYYADLKSCLYGGNYTAAYSFDMEISLKAKKK